MLYLPWQSHRYPLVRTSRIFGWIQERFDVRGTRVGLSMHRIFPRNDHLRFPAIRPRSYQRSCVFSLVQLLREDIHDFRPKIFSLVFHPEDSTSEQKGDIYYGEKRG